MVARAILSFFLKNSELKTTHNTFRDCRVHFFRNSCKHFAHSLCATRARKHLKLCAHLFSSYEYLVKLSISVVVLRAYALNVFFSELDFRHTLGGAQDHFPKKRADNLPILENKCLEDREFAK